MTTKMRVAMSRLSCDQTMDLLVMAGSWIVCRLHDSRSQLAIQPTTTLSLYERKLWRSSCKTANAGVLKQVYCS